MKKFLISLLLVGSAFGATYTVAPSGGDYTTWAALISAHPTLSAGDVVIAQAASPGGTYDFAAQWTVPSSGNSSNHITIRARVGDTIKVKGFDLSSRSYVDVFGFEVVQATTSDNFPGFKLSGTTNCTIEKNYVHNTYKHGIAGLVAAGNNNNAFRYNTFDDVGYVDLGAGGGDSIVSCEVRGNYNTFEYNTVTRGMDSVRFYGTGNVMAMNYLGPKDTNRYTSSSPYPSHSDDFQSFEGYEALTQLAIYGNWMTDNKDSVSSAHAHSITIQNGGAGTFTGFLMARNVLARPSTAAVIIRNIKKWKMRNNTFYAINNNLSYSSGNAFYSETPQSDTIDTRNNIWAYGPNTIDAAGLYYFYATAVNFTGANDNAWNVSGTQPTLPASMTGKMNLNPGFNNIGADDFTLTSGSAMRNAGAAITLANGAGTSSVTLVVLDASRLFDGYGAPAGPGTLPETISIGGGSAVRISSIDYPNNIVTLSAARSWVDGATVVPAGSADLGALPYGTSLAPSITSAVTTTLTGSATATVVVGNSASVRAVRIVQDYVQKAISYDTSSSNTYTLNFTGTGSANLSVQVFSENPSKTPVVETTVSVSGGGDVTAPTLSSATIASNGTTLTLAFSETVTIGAGGNAGWTFIPLAGGAATVSYTSGSGSSSLVYTISRAVQQGEVASVGYTQPGNGVEDSAGNDLVTIASSSVTNNSTQVTAATPTNYRKPRGLIRRGF